MKRPMPWFRFYSEALDDPKVQRLPVHLFKTWVNMLCLAGVNDGVLPSVDDIAFRLRLSPTDAAQQIDDLILAGLIDIAPNGDRQPHNWQSRQFVSDSSTERVRKHRKNNKKQERNADETLHGTAPDSEADSETETEGHTDRPDCSTAREERTDGRTAAYGDLKKAFNGSTEAMLVFVERAMGGRCRPNAEQWLCSTVSAYGQSAVAQAFAILVEKQAAGEISSRPLPHWSSLARGMNDRQRSPPRSPPSTADKPSLSEILRRKREAEATA